jgi:nucleoside-diphosphate-sugar epimerase
MNILITGVSGFIGKRLVEHLSEKHNVIGMSRGKLPVDYTYTQLEGSFDQQEDLQKLDAYEIDAVIHLAAVTGGCSEEEGLAVNVQGTRRLFRYLLDRGCRKFVAASSIAAVGSLDKAFRPQQLPIPDEHPCLATDAYGLSKAMGEELARYFHRSVSDADFIQLRFGSVVPDDWSPPAIKPDTELSIPFVLAARVYASDVVAALQCTVEAPLKSGARVFNVVGPDASCDVPTIDMLQGILRQQVHQYDLSYYELPGHTNKPLYAMDRIREELGFAPQRMTGRR